ncbi:MAG: YfiR family protein [Desulfobacterales bacterium]|nr:YfiR family protein [Desulfobacterales bacterium]
MRSTRAFHSLIIVSMVCGLSIVGPSFAEDVSVAPAPLQGAVLTKLLGFHKKIAGGGDVTVIVIGNKDFAGAMNSKGVGKPVGKSKIATITEMDAPPGDAPAGNTVIYCGDPGQLDATLAYSRQHKVLSMTGDPELVAKGITLGVGVLNKKPKILLNLSSTKEEDIDWNPAILKVAVSVN